MRQRLTILMFVSIAFALSVASISGQEKPVSPDQKYRIESNISYYGEKETDKSKERCRLDVYVPTTEKGFATVVWFHGGGLTGGDKQIPNGLKEKGFAVVGATYRLSPQAKSPEYVEDAAAAVAWVFANIEKYGGDRKKIFVSGASAGGYLTSLIGLDKHYLEKHGIDANEIAGLIPLSGHTITHFTIRKERGIADTQAVVDELAPLFHVRKDAAPILLVTGDRELEMLGRYEENAYFWRMLKLAGHKQVELQELKGFDHGGMVEPALPLLIKFVEQHSSKAK